MSVLELALEALEDSSRYSGYDVYGDTIAALKEALATMPLKTQGEPVAEVIAEPLGGANRLDYVLDVVDALPVGTKLYTGGGL